MAGRRTQHLLRGFLGGLIAIVTIPAALAIAPASAPAATKSKPETALHRIQRTVARIDAEAKTPEGEARVLKRLSAQLSTTEETLKQEHDAWGLGYGELAMAYGFARASRSGKTPSDVVTMRTAGAPWLDIAKRLGVRVDTVANRMKRHVGPKAAR